MDGHGAWRDNVFVERLWKSVKYERVYVHACDSVSDHHAIFRLVQSRQAAVSSLGKKKRPMKLTP